MRTFTREAQEQMRPIDAFHLLEKGNRRFQENLRANRNLLTQMNETSDAQFPFATILSCIDSRVSAELVFDQGLGDIFSIRIAGNFIDEDILGSMEFTCKIAGAKLILVLGHTRCGAIKGACDDLEMGHLTSVIQKLRPAVLRTKEVGDRSSENESFVDRVSETNVHLAMRHIYDRSPILQKMIDADELAIAGGLYDVQTGAVDFFDDNIGRLH
ncbi:MAG: hypothetical protein KBF88_09315 [Polyangiaceae bacterium]|nr:hypothetical protein [Polyangiaceae bacterium]